MKWGNIDEIDASEKLLYWVIMFVISPYFDDPIDHWLKDIVIFNGGIGGDPGWEMQHISEGSDVEYYRVWGDPEMSGIIPAEAMFSVERVNIALRESLLALGEIYPEKIDELSEVIIRYRL